MKKSLFQKVVCLILSVTLLLGALGITASAASDNESLKPDSSAATLTEMQSLIGTSGYDEYLLKHADAKPGK